MGMPNDFVLVRHGQSEGNVAINAAGEGNNDYYTDAFTTTPGHRWRITHRGQKQAQTIGEWLRQNVTPEFDKYFVSPYVRTRETAANLQMPEAQWNLNRALRERDWGDIGSLPKPVFENEDKWAENFAMKNMDPLYWQPPGGESIAQVAEDRVRNVLSTLHRENAGQKILAVSHGECMWAFRIVLERLNDETFLKLDQEKAEKIENCEVLHYSRIDPQTGLQAPRLTWLRRARPVEDTNGNWKVEETPWKEIPFTTYSNEELLHDVDLVPYLFEE